MELLLNLAWLFLALPAYWVWRRGVESRLARRVSALQCLLALACVLILLFPVISATDDLHVMRIEMEDSAASKRAVRQAGSDKISIWVNRLQGFPATLAETNWHPVLQVGLFEGTVADVSLLSRTHVATAGRAPPLPLLG